MTVVRSIGWKERYIFQSINLRLYASNKPHAFSWGICVARLLWIWCMWTSLIYAAPKGPKINFALLSLFRCFSHFPAWHVTDLHFRNFRFIPNLVSSFELQRDVTFDPSNFDRYFALLRHSDCPRQAQGILTLIISLIINFYGHKQYKL